jgi:hypothetical protein
MYWFVNIMEESIMGMPTVKITRGRTKSNDDPNQLHFKKLGGTPKSIFRKQKRRRARSGSADVFLGWFYLIFLIIPLGLLLVLAFPKFFLGIAGLWLLIKFLKYLERIGEK